jgi:hypothetical protein
MPLQMYSSWLSKVLDFSQKFGGMERLALESPDVREDPNAWPQKGRDSLPM